MKKEPLDKALSLFGRKPDFLEEDNAALRYAFMIGQAPVTENGEFMLELGRAGLAQEFLKTIKKFCDDVPQATPFKRRIHEAAFAFADEYVRLMQEQNEKITDEFPVYIDIVSGAVQTAGIRFVGHMHGNIEWMHSFFRKDEIECPTPSGMVFLAWLSRPLPIPNENNTALCA